MSDPASKPDGGDAAFGRARVLFLAASIGVAAGLAVAGTIDKTAGGVIVVAAWVFGVASLHRLGRVAS